MTEKRPAGGKRRDIRPATIRGLADDAARLLDRLREEPLPEDAAEAAALRIATRNAFLLVEELRTLAIKKVPISAIPGHALPEKIRKNRPFFLESGEPEEDRDDRAAIDFEAYRRRADRAYLRDRMRA